MTHFFAYVIGTFCNIIIMLIVVQAIMSWFVPMFGPALGRIYNLVISVTEPFIRPFRRLTQGFTYRMGIDFSPVLAIFAIELVARILISLLYHV